MYEEYLRFSQLVLGLCLGLEAVYINQVYGIGRDCWMLKLAAMLGSVKCDGSLGTRTFAFDIETGRPIDHLSGGRCSRIFGSSSV